MRVTCSASNSTFAEGVTFEKPTLCDGRFCCFPTPNTNETNSTCSERPHLPPTLDVEVTFYRPPHHRFPFPSSTYSHAMWMNGSSKNNRGGGGGGGSDPPPQHQHPPAQQQAPPREYPNLAPWCRVVVHNPALGGGGGAQQGGGSRSRNSNNSNGRAPVQLPVEVTHYCQNYLAKNPLQDAPYDFALGTCCGDVVGMKKKRNKYPLVVSKPFCFFTRGHFVGDAVPGGGPISQHHDPPRPQWRGGPARGPGQCDEQFPPCACSLLCDILSAHTK
jgi:hypothetical protein